MKIGPFFPLKNEPLFIIVSTPMTQCQVLMAMTNWLQTPPMFFPNGLLRSFTSVFRGNLTAGPKFLFTFIYHVFTWDFKTNSIFFSVKSEFTGY